MAANITIANILKAGLQAAYNQLETKDASTLYFCTDTGKMYKGDVDFTESVKVVATKPTTPVVGKVYILQDTNTVEAYDGSAWHTITPAVSAQVGLSSTDDTVPTSKAVYDFVTKIAETITGSDKVVTSLESTTPGKINYKTADEKDHEVTLTGVSTGVQYEAATRKFTFHTVGSEDLVVELGKDIFVDPTGDNTYHADTKEIWLTLNNGTESTAATVIKIPAAGLVNILTGETSSSVKVTVDNSSGKIKAEAVVKENADGFTNALKLDDGGLYVDLSAYTTTTDLTAQLTELEKKITKAQETADANASAIAIINGDDATEGSFAKAVADAKKVIDANVAAAKEQADKGVADAAAAQATANQNAENITAIADALRWGSF